MQRVPGPRSASADKPIVIPFNGYPRPPEFAVGRRQGTPPNRGARPLSALFRNPLPPNVYVIEEPVNADVAVTTAGFTDRWATIDLNDYTVSLGNGPKVPIATLSWAAIRGADNAMSLGFSEHANFTVASTGPAASPSELLALVRYVIPFTGLRDADYEVDPQIADQSDISKPHAQAYADFYFA